MRAFHPDGVKFAVMPGVEQIPALLNFARRVGTEFSDSCVLGMGLHGTITRLACPLLGCPYTYGFLGADPVAPGQISVEDLRAFFELESRTPSGRPALDAPGEQWRDWANRLLNGPSGV
jgi:3-dehydroquinate dehydratase type I